MSHDVLWALISWYPWAFRVASQLPHQQVTLLSSILVSAICFCRFSQRKIQSNPRGGTLIFSFPRIALNYAKTWMLFDLSLVSMDWIFRGIEFSNESGLEWLGWKMREAAVFFFGRIYLLTFVKCFKLIVEDWRISLGFRRILSIARGRSIFFIDLGLGRWRGFGRV